MLAHIFSYNDWFMNRDEDWDCNDSYVAIVDDKLEFLNHGSGFYRKAMEERYPHRVEHGSIHTHRGTIEANDVTDKLKLEYPAIWERLNKIQPIVRR